MCVKMTICMGANRALLKECSSLFSGEGLEARGNQG